MRQMLEMHPDAVARMDQLTIMHRQAQQKLRQGQKTASQHEVPQSVEAKVDPLTLEQASSRA
jgi:hypothetical protein